MTSDNSIYTIPETGSALGREEGTSQSGTSVTIFYRDDYDRRAGERRRITQIYASHPYQRTNKLDLQYLDQSIYCAVFRSLPLHR
jgi:hypothetical protein